MDHLARRNRAAPTPTAYAKISWHPMSGLTEQAIIELFARDSPWIGDDCAVLPHLNEQNWLLTQDLLVEEVHFNRQYFSPEDLAHKALAVNLSDIAAMGGCPCYALLSIAIPLSLTDYAWQFCQNFQDLCRSHQLPIVGGDTTRAPTVLTIEVTLIGQVASHHIKRRHGARVGDAICVAGNLGLANLGLATLRLQQTQAAPFTVYQQRPKALLEEGRWLGEQAEVSAMMDISDGFATDLAKLTAASDLGATIDLDRIPLEPEFIAWCKKLNCDPLLTKLAGGEDYALLFTVDPHSLDSLVERFRHSFTTPLCHLGSLQESPGLVWLQNHKPIELHLQTFAHFP